MNIEIKIKILEDSQESYPGDLVLTEGNYHSDYKTVILNIDNRKIEVKSEELLKALKVLNYGMD